MDGLNDQSLLDVRKLISGKDGRLFVTTKAGTNIFLAEVDTFQTQISPANTDYQPVGSALVYAVNTGYSVTLTLTEAVVRDNVMLDELITDLQNGYFPTFDFQGKMRRRDGRRCCILRHLRNQAEGSPHRNGRGIHRGRGSRLGCGRGVGTSSGLG